MATPKKFNVNVVVRTYKDEAGAEKRVWRSVGELTLWKESGTIDLYGFDGVKTLSVFEQKKAK